MAQNIDRLYHPEKGVVKSNNERRRCNKFPDEHPIANHNIAGTSKIRAGAVSPTKIFHPPNNSDKFIKDTNKFGVPNYWSVNGQLIVSHTGSVLCNYCGIPSHSREKCRLKMEYVFRIHIFGPKNDGEKWSRKIFLKFLHAQATFH